MPRMPRVQTIVLPILREAPTLIGVSCVSWIPSVDKRTFPILNVRRIGGPRLNKAPNALALPVIELTAYGKVNLESTEELYENALEALYEAVRRQTQTPNGYLHSIKETMGATEFPSPFQDSWRVQGLIQLGVRPPRTP